MNFFKINAELIMKNDHVNLHSHVFCQRLKKKFKKGWMKIGSRWNGSGPIGEHF